MLCFSEQCLSTAKQLKLKNLFATKALLEKVLAGGKATLAQVRMLVPCYSTNKGFEPLEGKETAMHLYVSTVIPYSAKILRRIIFAVFADWSRTVKIKLANFFNTSSAQRLSLDSELYMYRHANMEHTLNIFFGT